MTLIDFANIRRRTVLIFLGLLLLTRWSVGAATLTLSGPAEGSQLALPVGVTFTNVAFAANVSGVGGSVSVRFTLEGQGAAFAIRTAAPPYSVTFSNLPAAKYFLSAQVVTDTNVAADLSFDIVPASSGPANDLWSQSLAIPSPGVSVFATNTFATVEASEPRYADNNAGRSVWWSWLAGASGMITATTDGSGFDTVLGIYTGTNVGALTLMGANDDAVFTNRSSQVTFSAVAGTKYYFAVDGAVTTNGVTESGMVQLRLLAAAPPSVALVSPTNGQVFFTTLALRSISASAAISDVAGIERVEFALNSATLSRSETVSPPYQWTLTNLPPGDYLLTASARNNLGLISTAHASFSVFSLRPELVFVDSPLVSAGFQFAVTGMKGVTYELQAATNFLTWNRLSLWTNFDGALRVADTNAAQFSMRYYRVISE